MTRPNFCGNCGEKLSYWNADVDWWGRVNFIKCHKCGTINKPWKPLEHYRAPYFG